MIETNNLTKQYGEITALQRLNLRVEDGEWFLYLGPNGAGKSTTLKILMGLLQPSSGEASIAGFDPRTDGPALRRVVGYLPEDFDPYPFLTGREFLQLVGDLHGLGRRERDRAADRLLDLLDLTDGATRLAREYSHGMRKKLGLAAALIHEPKVLVLDEPTAELDPRTSDLIRQILRGLADRGLAIIMSTHILGTAEKQCDTVGILHDGTLIRSGAPESLVAAYPGLTLEEVFLLLTGGVDAEKVDAFLSAQTGLDAPKKPGRPVWAKDDPPPTGDQAHESDHDAPDNPTPPDAPDA